MQRLKKIEVLSLAYILAGIYFVIGILLSIMFAIAREVPEMINQIGDVMFLKGWSLLFFPIIYALMGFVQGFFIAIIYNLIARRTGGVIIELSQKAESKPVQAKKKKK